MCNLIYELHMNTVYLAHRCHEAAVVVCIVIICKQGLFFHVLVWNKIGTKWSVFHPALVVICNVRRISVKKDREHTKACKGSRHKQLWKQNMKGKRPTYWQDLPIRNCMLCGEFISCIFPWEKAKFAFLTGGPEETSKEKCCEYFLPRRWSISKEKTIYYS